MSIISLPTETLNAIFLHLPAPQLAAIASTSFHFNAIAERLLYSNLTISDSLTFESPRPERFLVCCHALHRRTHLLDGVKKLHIKWQSNRDALPQISLDPFCDIIHCLLPYLPHLEHLDLSLGPANILSRDTSIHPVERALGSCSLPLLQSCSLGAEWIKGGRPYSSALTRFLESLPLLTHLKLTDCKAMPNPPAKGTLHSLSTLRAAPEVAASILPGRSIRSLGLQGQDSEIYQEALVKMSLTSTPLQSLDLSGISIRPVTLRVVACHFPNVERVRIRLALRHTLHYALSGIRLLTGLSSVLKCFSSLVFLDLSPTTASGMVVSTAEDERGLCLEWNRVCPSMKRVTFPSQMTWGLTDDGAWHLTKDLWIPSK